MCTVPFCYRSSNFMEEKLFFGGVKGGKTTKIITLNGKKMRKIPSTIGNLTGLKVLNLQNNLIPSVCSEFSTLTQVRKNLSLGIKGQRGERTIGFDKWRFGFLKISHGSLLGTWRCPPLEILCGRGRSYILFMFSLEHI